MPGAFHRLYPDGRRLTRTLDGDEALARLESALELSVSRKARDVVFVHAGVVGLAGPRYP